MTKQAKRASGPPAIHRPTKAEMEEVVVVGGTPDEIAAAVLRGGVPRKEATETSPE